MSFRKTRFFRTPLLIKYMKECKFHSLTNSWPFRYKTETRISRTFLKNSKKPKIQVKSLQVSFMKIISSFFRVQKRWYFLAQGKKATPTHFRADLNLTV